jgi:ferredoxin
VNGPQSWKQFLFPPSRKLVSWQRQGKQFLTPTEDNGLRNIKYAFIGVRPCELHAILIQDKIFTMGPYTDPYYKSLRDRLFIVAVNCTKTGGTCFCASTQTGPRAMYGFDLALTEVTEGRKHFFVVETGSDKGEKVIGKISRRKTTPAEQSSAERLIDNAKAHMGRELKTSGIKDAFLNAYEHPRWDNVASRCLNCTNCTMVCPTCFCSTVEDLTDLTGSVAERCRKWDSCFTMDFSYIHGGSVRPSAKARYRQWITHKLATWIDQFGTMGCVGCGRCITWCPVGIDITEEAKAIQE